MSLVVVNPYIHFTIAGAPTFIYGVVDKEVSNDLQASLGGSRSVVRTKGSGNDAYLAIDSTVDTLGNTSQVLNHIVRLESGIVYVVLTEKAILDPRVQRITMTLPILNRARKIIYFISNVT